MRPEHADRLARLHEQRLVVAAAAAASARSSRSAVVRSRRASRAAVDDELLGVLGDLGIEVVEQHPQRRLGLPRARVQRRPARRPDRREVAAQRLDRVSSVIVSRSVPCRSPLPSLRATPVSAFSRPRRARIRRANRHQLHAVATTKNTAAATSARSRLAARHRRRRRRGATAMAPYTMRGVAVRVRRDRRVRGPPPRRGGISGALRRRSRPRRRGSRPGSTPRRARCRRTATCPHAAARTACARARAPPPTPRPGSSGARNSTACAPASSSIASDALGVREHLERLAARRRSPSRRDPPARRSSGSSRRSPGARAPCSPRRAPRRRTAGS